jgi:GDP-L-fucose synthase
MEKNSRIYVAGHTGLVGSAICRELEKQGYENIIKESRSKLNLIDGPSVHSFFRKSNPEYVFLAAARVGGIEANIKNPAQFIIENTRIQINIIWNSFLSGVQKLLFLGSSCIYPRDCKQPIKEECFMTGTLEPTNKAYAVAKINGVCMCQAFREQYSRNFISVMPTNLYGPNDNYDLNSCHVLPALIRRFHDAKIRNDDFVTLFGTGMPRREFLYVDDCANACVKLMNEYDSGDIINIGTGRDCTIQDLAIMVSEVVGFKGEVLFDSTKPNGMMQKLLDCSKINSLGWHSSVELVDGLRKTYEDFLTKEI